MPVIKHGNRAVSSSCGSADVLSELGFNLNLTDEQIVAQAANNQFVFCFAQIIISVA